jgi:co-chaperonin GroES (HSP10)
MNTFQLLDGRMMRVLGNNILVERVKLPDTYRGSSIIIDRQKEDATAIGIIRAVGRHAVKKPRPDGPEYVPIDVLEPGMKCAFLWFYAERHTNLQIQERLGQSLLILKWEDISFAWDASEEHEVSGICSMGA